MTTLQKAEKKKIIDRARDRVLAGADIAGVAREVSQDKFSASRGGDIGYFQRGENENAFDDVAFSTQVGTEPNKVQNYVDLCRYPRLRIRGS